MDERRGTTSSEALKRAVKGWLRKVSPCVGDPELGAALLLTLSSRQLSNIHASLMGVPTTEEALWVCRSPPSPYIRL
jgi:hypothetical protein